ncbi:FAD:protein FMN transferase [Sansalvadorimonas sp. 2012CJ34-2]|uniref:FAD:protein FMN transferase n=1 Tax=Parendozoicomonas callyspongiae TaxID=2942213 RepID=A0ABT0PEL7_9GAMM|nr:FAD:protein FMN transferase [Sansalvadorimonas sp. 2012CJ34-2]MCL6269823.1 FAD:protein FMN transferase [Sansalvadorimonas sp. 2012CJ34-2]
MSKRSLFAVAAVLCVVAVVRFSGVLKSPYIAEAGGPTMGTSWSAKYVAVDTPEPEVQDAIAEALEAVNVRMSTYRKDSELMELNRAPVGQPYSVSEQLFRLVEQGQTISELSDGAYDITVGALVNLWGFGRGKGATENLPENLDAASEQAFSKWLEKGRVSQIPTATDIDQAKQKVGYRSLILDRKNRTITKEKPVFIDLSSIAKGYGVDEAALAIEALGIDSYMLEVGGEIRLRGVKPDGESWKIAVREPVLESKVNTIVSMDNKGIATSGDYLQYIEVDGVHYSHLIDARTGYPEKHRLASVAVINDDTGLADAWATAFMILGEKAGPRVADKAGVDALFIYHTDKGFQSMGTGKFSSYIVGK